MYVFNFYKSTLPNDELMINIGHGIFTSIGNCVIAGIMLIHHFFIVIKYINITNLINPTYSTSH